MTNLGIALTAYIQKLDVEGQKIATEIGIAKSTLSRVRQGKMPDAEGFSKIIAWLARPPRPSNPNR